MRKKFWPVMVLLSAGLFTFASFAMAAVVELKFYYPVHLTGPLAKVIEGMVNDFNKQHPNIRVEPVWGGNYWQNMQKTVAALQSGNPPDVAVHLAIDVITLRDLDAVIPLDDFIAREGGEKFLEDFFPAFVKDFTADGKIWAIPFQRSTPILYYNKELFQKAGLDPNRPPETWDELLEYAQKLTVRDGAGNTQQWGLLIPDDPWLLMSFILQNDGRTHSPDGKKVYIAEKPAVEALQFWVDLANKYKVMPRHRSFPESVQDFVAQKGAMLIHSTGNLRFVRDSAKFPWNVAFLPRQKKQAVAIGGAGLFIFKNIPKASQEAAWEFTKWMTSTESAVRWGIGSGYIAVRKSAWEIPTMKEYTSQLPQALVARDQLPYALPEMSTHDNQKVREVFRTYFQEVLDEKYTPEEGLRKAQEEMERILAAFQ